MPICSATAVQVQASVQAASEERRTGQIPFRNQTPFAWKIAIKMIKHEKFDGKIIWKLGIVRGQVWSKGEYKNVQNSEGALSLFLFAKQSYIVALRSTLVKPNNFGLNACGSQVALVVKRFHRITANNSTWKREEHSNGKTPSIGQWSISSAINGPWLRSRRTTALEHPVKGEGHWNLGPTWENQLLRRGP